MQIQTSQMHSERYRRVGEIIEADAQLLTDRWLERALRNVQPPIASDATSCGTICPTIWSASAANFRSTGTDDSRPVAANRPRARQAALARRLESRRGRLRLPDHAAGHRTARRRTLDPSSDDRRSDGGQSHSRRSDRRLSAGLCRRVGRAVSERSTAVSKTKSSSGPRNFAIWPAPWSKPNSANVAASPACCTSTFSNCCLRFA